MPSSVILCGGNDARSTPRNLMEPDVSLTRPEMARKVVLLPAPFAPSRPPASPSPALVGPPPMGGTLPEDVLTAESSITTVLRGAGARSPIRDRRGSLLGFRRRLSGCLRQSSGRDRAQRCAWPPP